MHLLNEPYNKRIVLWWMALFGLFPGCSPMQITKPLNLGDLSKGMVMGYCTQISSIPTTFPLSWLHRETFDNKNSNNDFGLSIETCMSRDHKYIGLYSQNVFPFYVPLSLVLVYSMKRESFQLGSVEFQLIAGNLFLSWCFHLL